MKKPARGGLWGEVWRDAPAQVVVSQGARSGRWESMYSQAAAGKLAKLRRCRSLEFTAGYIPYPPRW
jgi:hypothetical protein